MYVDYVVAGNNAQKPAEQVVEGPVDFERAIELAGNLDTINFYFFFCCNFLSYIY